MRTKDKIEPQQTQCVGLWKVDYLKYLFITSFLWAPGQLMTTNGVGVGVNFKILQYSLLCSHSALCVLASPNIS